MQLMDANREWSSRPDDERYETLETLGAAVHARHARSRSYKGDLSALSVAAVPDGSGSDFRVRLGSGVEARPTHWAFGQLATSFGVPGGYLRTLPPALAMANFEHAMTVAKRVTADPQPVKVLIQSPTQSDAPARLMAVNSADYGRIWDDQVVALATHIRDRSDGTFHNPPDWSGKPSGLYASDRDVFVFLVDGGSVLEEPGGFGHRPSALHRGVILRNSEVGNGWFEAVAFLFRVVCGNHIVWDATDVARRRIRHNRLAPEHFDREAYRVAAEHTRSFDPRPALAGITRAMQFALPAPEGERVDWLTGLGQRAAKFTQAEAHSILATADQEEGGSDTLWRVVQGATSIAKRLPHADMATDLSRRAGALMRLVA